MDNQNFYNILVIVSGIYLVIHLVYGLKNMLKPKTKEQLMEAANRIPTSKTYKLQELAELVKRNEKNGVEMDLDFYPRTNYFILYHKDNPGYKSIAYSQLQFHDSYTLFKDHLKAFYNDVYVGNYTYHVELTPEQEKFIGLKTD
jgi:hypothetical protein